MTAEVPQVPGVLKHISDFLRNAVECCGEVITSATTTQLVSGYSGDHKSVSNGAVDQNTGLCFGRYYYSLDSTSKRGGDI